ncbi:MAG: PIN domain-containing protein [Betaproteobacteria bacterium]|nr:PIN domain-containing protein [Betaproteobacteria bacterium]
MTPDVNVLVAASRGDHPHHAVARTWLEGALTESALDRPFALLPMVIASFLRLVTSPRVFRVVTPIEDAVAFVDALLTSPGVELLPVGPEWPRLRRLCLDQKLGGNDMPDAWLSAVVVHLGEHLVTFDRDFRRLLTRSQLTVLRAG